MKNVLVCLAVLTGVASLANAKQAKHENNAQQIGGVERHNLRDEQTKPSAETKQHQPNEVSAVRGIERKEKPPADSPSPLGARSFDGSENHLDNPEMGQAHIALRRIAEPDYGDGISSLAGESRPSARAVSNGIFAQATSRPNSKMATDFLWQWGQFLDHDLDLTDGVEPAENANIQVPLGDAFFDPQGSGVQHITFNRSLYDLSTGSSPTAPRQQINEITAWIDASNVYGSDAERANALRKHDGSGQLLTSAGNLLPFNLTGLPNAGGNSATLFVAGDVRANEQIGLTTMHTLFVREHNRLAERIAERHPDFSDEEIYQRARQEVIALMQVITYEEFLPLILGENAIPAYAGYSDRIDAGITNEFSTAAYRFGHTLLSPTILRLDAQGETMDSGNLALRDAFFRPDRLINEGGIEPVLRGLAAQVCQSIDSFVIDDVRNFLFGAPGAGGFDLVSLNIQRGRDHGLASYNATRSALGLAPARQFSDLTSDPEVLQRLSSTYDSVEDIDLWVGGLAEMPHRDAMVGETFYHIIKRQFVALRDGDRFWYENDLPEQKVRKLKNTRLSDVIKRNTEIGSELQENVFLMRP